MNDSATLAEVLKEFAQQQIEGCSGFVFPEEFSKQFLLGLQCFNIFWTILDNVFKADILPTCDYFERQVIVSQTRPFLFLWQH